MSVVVVLVTLHVCGCCLGYSPCLWLLSWLLSMSVVVVLVTLHVSGVVVEQHTFHIGIKISDLISC